ncbi:hypothetical protein JTE90_027102 [Oedothorax gibbosus]|uniref:Uncharacterized protein n=1 Tax=Oedothorax gibbosus TaxID=931172 RepID=A0AAV6TR09_9ARAC|nr:hypothetical protein JTE90_027102 [Oedothorax gibbosus]
MYYRAGAFKVISGSACSPRFLQKCVQTVFWLDITKPLLFVQSMILRIAICSCLYCAHVRRGTGDLKVVHEQSAVASWWKLPHYVIDF